MLKLLCLCAALGWMEPPPDSILDLLKSSPSSANLNQRPDTPARWLGELIEKQTGWQCDRFLQQEDRFTASAGFAGRDIRVHYQPQQLRLRLTCELATLDNSGAIEQHLDRANAWTQLGRTTRMFVDANRRIVLRADLNAAHPSNARRVAAMLAGFAADLRRCGLDYPLPLTSPADQNAAPPQARQYHELGKQTFLANRNDPQQRARAVELLERAVQAAPEQDAFKIDLADAYVQMGHDLSLAFATDYYEDVLQRRPENPQLLARLSEAYLQLGNQQAAFDYAARRLNAAGSKDRYMAALQLATVAMQTGRHSQGADTLEQTLKVAPADQGVRLLLAAVRAEAGDKQQAAELIREVQAQLTPADPLYATTTKMLARMKP